MAEVPDQEKQNIATGDARREADAYISKYTELMNQYTRQKSTMDTIKGAKDKVQGLEQDLTFSVSTFSKQISEIQNQINVDRQRGETVKDSWFDSILNILILLSFGFAIYSVGRALFSRAVSVLPQSMSTG